MRLPSGLPEQVADAEDVARFLTSSGHFNASAVRPSAFMPNPRNGETSVFRHGAKPRADLIAIGEREVGGTRPVHGAALIKAGLIRKISLELRAGEPPRFTLTSSAGLGPVMIRNSERLNKSCSPRS